MKNRSSSEKPIPIALIPIEKLNPAFGTLPLVKMAEFMVPESASGNGPRYFRAFSPESVPRFSDNCAPAGDAAQATSASAGHTANEVP